MRNPCDLQEPSQTRARIGLSSRDVVCPFRTSHGAFAPPYGKARERRGRAVQPSAAGIPHSGKGDVSPPFQHAPAV